MPVSAFRASWRSRRAFRNPRPFKGASDFRAIGQGQAYGLSACGLALNVAEPAGEEFLVFRELWIEAADPGAKDVVIHALMDSPSLTGACQFRITKGAVTTMDFSAGLFPRVALAAVGLATDTSMFLFSDINRRRFDDFRKAAHDSDGLLMLNGAGEMLWRPLNNPAGVKISAFADSGTRGFGLMQRARHPGDYDDFAAHYERRPSLWVEPIGDWGQGRSYWSRFRPTR